MDQMDLFPEDKLLNDFKQLQEEMRKLQKAAFAQISGLRKEVEILEAHCQVMSDELFRREVAS